MKSILLARYHQLMLAGLLWGTPLVRAQSISPSAGAEKPSGTRDILDLDPLDVSGRRNDYFVASDGQSGTKTLASLIETPLSLAVITREQMDEQAVATVPQALRYTQVLSESRGDMAKLEYLFSRGFTMDQYLDGLKILGGSWGIAQIDAYALDRIEVLSGPASVLYGQANPGGIANLVTKLPTTKPVNEVQFQFGSHNLIEGAFDLGGASGGDHTFAYRLTGLARDANTQVDYTREQRQLIASAATWRFGAGTTLTVSGNYQHDPYGGFYNWVPAYGTVLPNPNGKLSSNFYAGDPNFDKYERTQVSLGYKLGQIINENWSLQQTARYGNIDTAYNNVFSSWLDADLRTLHRYLWRDREKVDAFTIDNRVEGKIETGALKQTLLFGVDYQHNHYDQLLGYDFASTPDLDLFAPVYHQPIVAPDYTDHTVQTQRQLGGYFQDQARIGRWALLAGGRYDSASSKTRDLSYGGNYEQDDHAFTGRAGAVYLLENGLAPYASYSRSFQPISGADFFGHAFKPTIGRQWEAGIKFQPAKSSAFVTASVFDLREKNVLTLDTDPAHPNSSVQTGEIRSRGVELSAVAKLVGALNLAANYSYLDNVVTKSNDTDLGKRPTAIPRHSASLWLNYDFTAGSVRGFALGLGARYVGSTFGNADNTFKVPAYAVYDAVLRYDVGATDARFRGWSVAVNASNLFDKSYISSAGGEDYAAFGLRRNVATTVRYRW